MSQKRLEKLKIVFEIEVQSEKVERSGKLEIWRNDQSNGVNDVEALETIIEILNAANAKVEFKENGEGEPISPDLYLRKVAQQGCWNRPLEIDGLRFGFASLPKFSICIVSIEELDKGSAGDWTKWIESFIHKEGFIQAWVSDVEYDYWQNVRDPLQYEAAGRDYGNLPTKSNGLPPPLEQVEIDTSVNPGKWLFRENYIEAIGSPMWLGEAFWVKVGHDRKQILEHSNDLNLVELSPGVLRLSVKSESFCDSSTEPMQRKLRWILYGTE
ncbi:hypothetical protein HBDW_15600 [Herbaspirillum sp. DW155]|uniref:hypothetical protein n=1 Tax=Herbaspirillum sp. DW155 TaxID=3095609 RepID=UPI00308DA2FA|nr:hypothetical protein HBDW_15600 [Herbaspirillum sp. DW155]